MRELPRAVKCPNSSKRPLRFPRVNTSVVLEDLEPNQLYTVAVAAESSSGAVGDYSAESATITAFLEALAPPPTAAVTGEASVRPSS